MADNGSTVKLGQSDAKTLERWVRVGAIASHIEAMKEAGQDVELSFDSEAGEVTIKLVRCQMVGSRIVEVEE